MPAAKKARLLHFLSKERSHAIMTGKANKKEE
jgi:hypothetical protein